MCDFLKKGVNFLKSPRRQRFCRWIYNYMVWGASRDFRRVFVRNRAFGAKKKPLAHFSTG